MRDYDSNYKMNPPLRSASDREAILAAIADGTVDAIATDHAPHAAQEKEMEFERAAFGITGLETALALAISRLHRDEAHPARPYRRTLHRRPRSLFRSARPRLPGSRLGRRRYGFRSEEEVDVRRRQVAARNRGTRPSMDGSSREKWWQRSSAGRSCTPHEFAEGQPPRLSASSTRS